MNRHLYRFASRLFLRKSADYRDGWVYMGKEGYGSRRARQKTPMHPDMYFDALGKIEANFGKPQGLKFLSFPDASISDIL